MSIINLTKDYFQSLKLITNPRRTFSSSSAGVTGSVALFPDASSGVKDLYPTYGESSGSWGGAQIEEFRNNLVQSIAGNPDGDWDSAFVQYMDLVGSASVPVRSSKRQEVLRFTPGVTLDKTFMKKNVVKNILFPYYRNLYRSAQWNYTNYNCLNFVTGGNLPTDSVLIYPAGTGSALGEDENPYGTAATGFTFDFYINPRYSSTRPGDEYTAGTILHMSSCFALSLVTGSSMGADGKPDGFRLLLQLSSSADIPPRRCAISGDAVTTPSPGQNSTWAFVSKDNSLKKNNWHHVAARWGGPSANNGTGSILIDGVHNSDFVVNTPTSSIMQVTSSGTSLLDPDALFVGNYYEGTNYGANAIGLFFNPAASRDEGVVSYSDNYPSEDPAAFSFAHPLNAELHDIKIFNKYKLEGEIRSNASVGSKLTSDLIFYVPPLFTKDSRKRYVLQTPFYSATGSSEDPFNVALAFGVGGLSINLENFTKEFVTNQFPRLFNLSASRIDTQVNIPRTADYLLYESGSSVKRNLTITPCDNGKFFPNFDLLKTVPSSGVTNISSGTTSTDQYTGVFDDRFVDAFGSLDFSIIDLSSMVDTGMLASGTMIPTRTTLDDENPESTGFENDGSLLVPLEGATPEDPGVAPGNILTVLQRTEDPSSNQVVFFDISNMFYGDRIKPKTLVIEDLSVTGSAGRMSFKFKDDGRGNLYRADSPPPHPTWSSVGNVLYEEGIIVIKTPHAPFFGKDSFKVSFLGERNVYVLEIQVPLNTSAFNSSSNPTYLEMAPSNYRNDTARKFTYITGLNLHDDNMNVIARANLAQPIVKTDSDKMVIKLRIDY